MSCNSHCACPTKGGQFAQARLALGRAALAGAFALAVCLAYPQAAQAATAQDAVIKSTAERNGVDADFKVQGQGRLRFFGLHVYDATLWASQTITTANYTTTPLALTLTYGRSLYGKLIAERSLKEMRGITAPSDAQAYAWLDAMTELFPDVQEGDQLTGIYQPGQRAVFWLNGKRLGEVSDPAFAPAFFGIWLDEKSSEPSLRNQLLGMP